MEMIRLAVKRWRQGALNYYNDLTSNAPPVQRTHTIKGQRFREPKPFQSPTPTRQQVARYSQIAQSYVMQPRTMRLKSAMWFCIYMGWIVGATLFIMNRLRGDDLFEMAKEVQSRERAKKELSKLAEMRK